MRAFVDTSALLALLDADQDRHVAVAAAWARLLEEASVLVTTNYVLVETTALVQRRLGLEALRVFLDDVVPVLETVWIDEAIHRAGLSALRAAARRDLSLVDCTSFEVMRARGARVAFAVDTDFGRQGFETLPA